MGAAMWSNPLTVAARKPEAEYAAWDSVAKVVYNSFALNPVWLQAEMRGQADRSRIAADALRDIARIDAEIAKSRSETMSKINDQRYLTLTGQQRYVNPHTGRQEVPLGQRRWRPDLHQRPGLGSQHQPCSAPLGLQAPAGAVATSRVRSRGGGVPGTASRRTSHRSRSRTARTPTPKTSSLSDTFPRRARPTVIHPPPRTTAARSEQLLDVGGHLPPWPLRVRWRYFPCAQPRTMRTWDPGSGEGKSASVTRARSATMRSSAAWPVAMPCRAR
jgi:hypothetical protein